MIVCGDPSRFAVKWEATYPGETPIGRFAVFIDGHEVGDFDDDGTHLRGCFCHTLELTEHWHDKFEPGLFEMDMRQAFEALVYPIFGHYYGVERREEIYPHTHNRFHIADIGMTSMELFRLLVMKDESGERTRFIWEDGQGVVREAHLPAREVEAVFVEFLEKADPDVPGARAGHHAWKAKEAEYMARRKKRNR